MERLIRNEKDELVYLNPNQHHVVILLDDKKLIESEEKDIYLPKQEGYPVYQIEEEGKSFYLKERHMKELGIVNFRDCGGYLNQEGKQVRYDVFYRSAPLIASKQLSDLKLKTLLDLRSEQEANGKKDEVPDGCEYYRFSAISQFDTPVKGNLNMEDLAKNKEMMEKVLDMRSIYAQMPFNNPAYQFMFKRIQEDKVPLVFHCSAGKDRTGVAAALILLMLGVPEETVIEDYLFSNECRKEENERIYAQTGNYTEQFKSMMMVQQELIEATLASIKERYKTYENYFLQEFDLNQEKIEALKSRYLY